MDVSRNSMLGELASDAASERTDFLVQATEQLAKFLDRNRDRIADLGGLTLIDEDPDYLSVAPDCTFRVRSRFEDPDTGEWVTETEIVETASELVELYNPGEVYAAFAEAAREAAGMDPQPTAAGDLLETAGVPPEDSFELGADAAYASAADEWAAGQPVVPDADDDESAALALYNLALDFQERSQASEARLIDQFQDAVGRLSGILGDLVIVDDEDERLTLTVSGRFRAEVLPEDGEGAEGEWRELTEPEDIVEFYDPTDVFGDLADALAEAFPSVAPEAEPESEGEDEGDDELEVEVETPEPGSRP
jgi:hypothetical protein